MNFWLTRRSVLFSLFVITIFSLFIYYFVSRIDLFFVSINSPVYRFNGYHNDVIKYTDSNCSIRLPNAWINQIPVPPNLPRRQNSLIPKQFYSYKSDTPLGFTQNNCYININVRQCIIESRRLPLNINKKTISVVILSAVMNTAVRQTIRRTYASIPVINQTHFIYTFFVGRSAAKHGPAMQQIIDYEFQRYGDIVQVNISDGYDEITFKCMEAFKWFSYFCDIATYFVRVTDDIFLNPFVLEEYLQTAPIEGFHNGMVFSGSPILSSGTKWDYKLNVPVDIPWSGTYASYYSGGFSIYSKNLAKQMYMMSRRTPLFFPDDAYLGVLLEKLGIYELSDRILHKTIRNETLYIHFYSDRNLQSNLKMQWDELVKNRQLLYQNTL